jgi:CheY-like chemotaxis protein
VIGSVRVLVVDDFEAFRRLPCSILETMPELQVICQASDGLEAVQRAEELQPDLILLDIGLPTLNGIEAARQIRRFSPDSKIIFLTLESSTDVVQEGLNLGARGYVLKRGLRSTWSLPSKPFLTAGGLSALDCQVTISLSQAPDRLPEYSVLLLTAFGRRPDDHPRLSDLGL